MRKTSRTSLIACSVGSAIFSFGFNRGPAQQQHDPVGFHDSHIRGQVRDMRGNPVAGADVGLISNLYPDQISRGRYATSARVKTDANGMYDFAGLNAGDYVVVLHPRAATPLDPNPPVFYPEEEFVTNATILHLQPSSDINEIDFVRPDPLHAVIVHVIVTRKAGTPIGQAGITANDQGSAITVVANEHTDTFGHADLQLLAGREYRAIAATPEIKQGDPVDSNIPTDSLLTHESISDTNGPMPTAVTSTITEQEQPVCAGPIEFIAKDGMILNLTPDKTWDECRSAPKPALTQ